MKQCKVCGKKSFFLRLDKYGLCPSCSETLEKIKKYKKEHEIDIIYDVYNQLGKSETYIENVYENDAWIKIERKREKSQNVVFWEQYMRPNISKDEREDFEYYLYTSPTLPNNCKYYILGCLYETDKAREEESRYSSINFFSLYLKEPPLPQVVAQTPLYEGMDNINREQHHLFLINYKISTMLSQNHDYEEALEYMIAAFDIYVNSRAMHGLYDAYRKVNRLPEFLKKLDYYYDKANLNKEMKKDSRENPSGWAYENLKLEAEYKIAKKYVFKPRS